MSHPAGLIDTNSTVTLLYVAADVLIALASLVLGLEVYIYGRDKADGTARVGCYGLTAFLYGAAILQLTDVWAICVDAPIISVSIRLLAAAMAVCVAGVLCYTTPYAPNLKTARLIEEQNKQLENENALLIESRNRAVENVELKTAFLATISHELRSQLSAVFGMNELLLHSDRLDDDQRKLVMNTADSAQSLLTTINDLHDLAKIDSGQAEVELVPMSVTLAIREATSLCSEGARRKKLFLNTDIDPRIPERVVGDFKRVRQILLHLIRNGVKFTESGGIIVQAVLEKQAGAQIVVRFCVKDTGLGLTEEEQRTFFDASKSTQGPHLRRALDSGIGLYMTKRLVDMMGGRMGVESRKGQGSSFWFSTQFSTSTEGATETASMVTPAVPPGAVALIAEDDPTLLELAMRQLKTLGVAAIGVGTGHEAIELLARNKIDVVFMDCHLPYMDGFEATRAIRQMELETGKHVPIVAMTADVLLSDESRCRDCGMDDYLAKPVTLDDLRGKLKRWLV